MERAGLKSKFDLIRSQAERLSELAREASREARRLGDIDGHRAAIEAHRKANIAWTKAHRAAINYGTKPWERKTYDQYVRHYDRVKHHWQRCWDLGTRRGISFPYGAPCGRTSDYFEKR